MVDLSFLSNKAKNLPRGPGCYLMKDSEGKILYIGKAKTLRSRVGSYFQQSVKEIKTRLLIEKIYDFDFILTENDAEAFVLENNLIKKYSPRYNIRLRDDKTYPYIVVDTKGPFPSPRYMRRPSRKEGRLVFGPFPVGSHIWELLRIVIKSFNLRDCSLKEFLQRKNPCILYQMKQCSAPCVGLISEEDYLRDLKYALDIFRGKGKGPLKVLREKMVQLAEKEEFEHAAILRDYSLQIENFLENSLQNTVEFWGSRDNVDVIASYQDPEGQEVDISIYLIREGALLGNKNFYFPLSPFWENKEEGLLINLLEYYSSLEDPWPGLVILPLEENLLKTFQEALGKISDPASPPQLYAQKKKYQRVWELAQKGAKEAYLLRREQQEGLHLALERLKDLLSLPERPRTIECYDIAIWQGHSPSASQIVFQDGAPLKEAYRYYHLSERPEKNNDVAMLKEVLERRITHEKLPDLFLIDGGAPQVNAVREVLKKHRLEIPVVGIAKSRIVKNDSLAPGEVVRTGERLVYGGNNRIFHLSQDPFLFRLMVQMRNEAHRFSRKLHHKAEKKRTLGSFLDQVPGVGPKTKQKILSQLRDNFQHLQQLSPEELSQMLGLPAKVARSLKTALDQFKT